MASFLQIRYMLMLMSFFAVFCGFIYNEFFSLSLNLFGSCYNEAGERMGDCTYSFGLDPIWTAASNSLTFVNSFKMKLAVVIGFAHMFLGVILKAINNVHFSTWLDFCCSFLPQVIFLTSTFGYLILMIFIKWNTNWSSSEPPSLINTYIEMFFNNGQVIFLSSLTSLPK